MCKTLNKADCGLNREYAIYVNIVLLPILFTKQFRNIGFFSALVLCFTMVSFGIISYISFDILTQDADSIWNNYKIRILPSDHEYKMHDWRAFPIFCATMMNIFEGNQTILNLYASADKPKSFFKIISVLFVIVSLCIGVAVGVLGYVAFGNSCSSTILLNMPNEVFIGVFAKVCYIVTIIGSYVLLCQPIFYIMESSKTYQELLEGPIQKERKERAISREHFEINSEESEIEYDQFGFDDPLQGYHINTLTRYFKFYFFRTMMTLMVTCFSFFFPSINILLAVGGSVMGTLMTIVMPVMFYNRAYSGSEKNLMMDKGERFKG
jgi:hypothetical protein